MTSTSVVTARPDILVSDVSGELLLLSLEHGRYFGLDRVGAHVWRQLDAPRSVAELRDAVLARFEVDTEQCERDLLELLDDLAAEGLVDINPSPDA